MFSITGKAAIVTGSGRGIGRDIALALARQGANLVISDIHWDNAQQVAAEIKALGRKAVAVKADVSQWAEVAAMVEACVKEFGRVDILVNNAAEQHPKESIEEISEEQLERTFRTNIFSFFFLTKAALKHLEKQKGCIINTTSVTAYRGSEMLLDYSSTKGAIVAFTRSLALSLIKKGKNQFVLIR